MDKMKEKNRRWRRRRLHVRRTLSGTAERPRLSVYRSLTGIYAQVIDDMAGTTLVASSSLSKEMKEKIKNGGNCGAAEIIGQDIARKAIGAGIKTVVFDRGGRKYHGRIKALAEAARKEGLSF